MIISASDSGQPQQTSILNFTLVVNSTFPPKIFNLHDLEKLENEEEDYDEQEYSHGQGDAIDRNNFSSGGGKEGKRHLKIQSNFASILVVLSCLSGMGFVILVAFVCSTVRLKKRRQESRRHRCCTCCWKWSASRCLCCFHERPCKSGLPCLPCSDHAGIRTGDSSIRMVRTRSCSSSRRNKQIKFSGNSTTTTKKKKINNYNNNKKKSKFKKQLTNDDLLTCPSSSSVPNDLDLVDLEMKVNKYDELELCEQKQTLPKTRSVGQLFYREFR